MIKLKNVSKSYYDASDFKKLLSHFTKKKLNPSVVALNDVSFSVDSGEIIGLIGPNGAGKTTVAKIISGLLRADKGEVIVLNQNPLKLTNQFKKSFALYRGEVKVLDDGVVVNDAINDRLRIYGKPPIDENEFVKQLIDSLKTTALMQKLPEEMSQGERTMVEFISAIAHQPKVMILDEPTNGLDIVATQRLLKLLQCLKLEYETTIIITSHNLHNIVSVADRIVLINKGQVVLTGPTEEILKKESGERKVRVELDPNASIDETKLKSLSAKYKLQDLVLTIESERSELKKHLSEVLEKFDVTDIKIIEPPLEKIFERYYQ